MCEHIVAVIAMNDLLIAQREIGGVVKTGITTTVKLECSRGLSCDLEKGPTRCSCSHVTSSEVLSR